MTPKDVCKTPCSAVVNECESVICNILDGIDKLDLLLEIPSQLA